MLKKPSTLADRRPELDKLNRILDWNNPSARCLLLRCQEATGTTYFAKQIAAQSSRSTLFHYDDLARIGDRLVESLIERLETSSIIMWFRILVAKEGPAGLIKRLLSKYIPVLLSPALASDPQLPSIPKFTFPKLNFSPYSSRPVEILARTLRSGLGGVKNIVLLVDNAQDQIPVLQELLASLHAKDYSNFRLVLFHVERGRDSRPFSDFSSRIRATGMPTTEAVFSKPSGELIADLALLEGRYLAGDECTHLANTSAGDIYRIVNTVRTSSDQVRRSEPVEEYLAALLFCAGQPLRESDIRILVLKTPLVYLRDEQQVTSSLAYLQSTGQVGRLDVDDSESLYRLESDSSPLIRQVQRDKALLLAVQDELYVYYKQAELLNIRHSQANVIRLLFRLSRHVEPEAQPRYAQRLVEVALGQGSIRNAERYIDIAVKEEAHSTAELYIRAALYISLQEYEKALDCYQLFPKRLWQEARVLRLFHAVIMNRLRHHSRARAELEELLASCEVLEEKTFIISYKLATMLHEYDFSGAKELFESNYDILSTAENFPYFLRNGGCVYFWTPEQDLSEAASLLERACLRFNKKRDWFGYYTTLSNLGTVYAYRSQSEEANRLFNESFEGLSPYGTHHLEECGFNLVMSLVLLGKEIEALRRAEKYQVFFEEASFPAVQLRSIKALLLCRQGQRKEAIEQMSLARDRAKSVGLREASLYAFHNSALISYLTGNLRGWTSFIEQAEEFIVQEGADLDALKKALRDGKVNTSRALDFFAFDYHQYWSQNPFEILGNASLPVETVA